jgi:hypothetical protein
VPQVGARLRRRDPPSPASFPAPVVAQLLRNGPSTTTPSPVRTGIKVVDLLCPFRYGDRASLALKEPKVPEGRARNEEASRSLRDRRVEPSTLGKE